MIIDRSQRVTALTFTIKIMANLQLKVNIFPLLSPEILFTINFFYDQWLKFINFYALRLVFLAVSRLTVNSIETLIILSALKHRDRMKKQAVSFAARDMFVSLCVETLLMTLLTVSVSIKSGPENL